MFFRGLLLKTNVGLSNKSHPQSAKCWCEGKSLDVTVLFAVLFYSVGIFNGSKSTKNIQTPV